MEQVGGGEVDGGGPTEVWSGDILGTTAEEVCEHLIGEGFQITYGTTHLC